MILVTGGAGLVGRHLGRLPGVLALPRNTLDVCVPDDVHAALDLHRPTAVVHCAGFTRVDAAEQDPATAYRVNAGGTEVVARACAERGVRLLALSTDYVLGAPPASTARLPVDAPPAPLAAYARSKLAGEHAALAWSATVVRVQWVYATDGTSFVNRALARMARGESVPLVTDQHGSPTPARYLARTLVELTAVAAVPPILHVATGGAATPAEWVCALATAHGIEPVWHPISRTALPGAPRPAWSCLDTSATDALLGRPSPHWRAALADLTPGVDESG